MAGAILGLALLHSPAQLMGATLPGAASVALAWNANPEPDITNYQLHYGTQPGVYPNSLSAGTSTTATVTGLVEGTTYYFEVSAWNQSNLQSAQSATVIYQIPISSISLTAWAAAANLAAADADPMATPHHDGIPNLLKYAFAMNGGGADIRVIAPGTGTEGLPNISVTDSGTSPVLRIEFLRRKNSVLTYTPCKSLDLQSWQPLSSTQPLSVTDLDTTWERVVYAEPCDPTNPSYFGRVEVMLP